MAPKLLALVAFVTVYGCSTTTAIRDSAQLTNTLYTAGRAAFALTCRQVARKCHADGDGECRALVGCQDNMAAFVDLVETARGFLSMAETLASIGETAKAQDYYKRADALVQRLTTVVEKVMGEQL
jgi:hypothetical protein